MADLAEGSFEKASKYAADPNFTSKPTNLQRTQIYGLYKQALEGDCNRSRPGMFDQVGRAKHDAWMQCQGCSKGEARDRYVKLITEIDPGFAPVQETEPTPAAKETAGEESPASAGEEGTGDAAASAATVTAAATVRSVSGVVSPFRVAAAHYAKKGANYSYASKLRLYSLYKQATMGDCDTVKPMFDISGVGSDRWDAWKKAAGMGFKEAEAEYIEVVKSQDQTFNVVLATTLNDDDNGLALKRVEEAVKAAQDAKDPLSSVDISDVPFVVDAKCFDEAVVAVTKLNKGSDLDAVEKLTFYGLYKQGFLGDNTTRRPGLFDPVGGAKWDAYNSRRGLSKEEAQCKYVGLVRTIVDGWEPAHPIPRDGGSRRSPIAEEKEGSTEGKPPPPPPPPPSPRRASIQLGRGSSLEALQTFGGGIHRAHRGPSLSSSNIAGEVRGKSPVPDASAMSSDEGDDVGGNSAKRGWLNKQSKNEMSIMWGGGGAKWNKRYFVLAGGSLFYYKKETDANSRGSFALHRCSVVKEGSKKNGQFHLLSLYVHGTESSERGPSSGALLRVSSETQAEIDAWHAALAPRCMITKTPEMPSFADSKSQSVADESMVKVADDNTAKQLTRALSAPHVAGQPVSPKDVAGKSQATAPDGKPKKMKLSFPASKPMHTCARVSFLSDEAPQQNYRGFLNLGATILVVTNLRFLLENFLKYGLLIRPLQMLKALFPNAPDDCATNGADLGAPTTLGWLAASYLANPCLACFVLMVVSAFVAYAVEAMAVRNAVSTRESHVLLLHSANVLVLICFPMATVWIMKPDPAHGTFTLFCVIVLWLKLISYFHVNRDQRMAARESAGAGADEIAAVIAKFANTVKDTEGLVRYPYNITPSDLLYFWAAPTLTYQLNFPRTTKVRPFYVIGLFFRMVVCVLFMIFLVTQHVGPVIAKSFEPIDNANLLLITERLLKLTVPVTYTWLIGFYLLFHLFLNFLAEILRFGDRVFYKDWWNATTFEQYWRLWNLPVHYWMVRHLYFPCVRAGLNKNQAAFACFLFSAIFHEVLVSIPFHMVRVYAFAGMLGQMPLVFITKKLERAAGQAYWWPVVGNVFFWVTFCVVGQPMSLLMYYYDIQREKLATGTYETAGEIVAEAAQAALNATKAAMHTEL